jgi:hypothetical protein
MQDSKGKLGGTTRQILPASLPPDLCTTNHNTQIKCDELKPACLKCTSTGRKCDGYVPPPPRRSRNQNALVETQSSMVPTKGLPLFPTTASSSEMRALEYFCVRTAPNMGMHFDADFWKSFMIPASMAEPALRHAMVAVGIFAARREVFGYSETAVLRTQSDLDSLPISFPSRGRTSDGDDVVALSSYNKSVSLLTKLVPSSRAIDVVLLACILFVCVEILRDDDAAAFRHFKGGMTIISDMVSRQNSSTDSRLMIDRVNESILPAFNRLEMLSALFGNDAPWPYPVSLCDIIPAAFISVSHARDSVVHLMNLSLRFVRTIQLLEYQPGDIPMSAYDEQTTLLTHLELWRSRFSAFRANYTKKLTPDDQYAANVLEIQRIVALTWVSTSMNPFQCAHDAHIPTYTAAVILAEQLSSLASARNKRAGQASTFLLDVEIVSPLFWLSVKCREPSVRRRAIAVQRGLQRHEGLWDSRIAAAIAERIMEIEEAEVGGARLPSEEARVHGLPFARDENVGASACLVCFMTKPFGVYGEWSVWQEEIPLGRS